MKIKKWLTDPRGSFQAWLEKPLTEKRERAKPAVERASESRLNRPDPLLILADSPARRRAVVTFHPGVPSGPNVRKHLVIDGEVVTPPDWFFDDWTSVDNAHRTRLAPKVDWAEVQESRLEARTGRRMARNQDTVMRQRYVMYGQAAATLEEGSEDEAAFIAFQAQAILARARHASDHESADTTTFAAVTA